MNRTSKQAAAGLAAAAMAAGAWLSAGPPAAAGARTPAAPGRVLWGAVTWAR